MSGAIFKTLPAGDFNIPSGQAAIQLEGESFLRPIGDCTISVSKSKEETEIRTNESPDREVVANDVTSTTQTISIVMRQFASVGMALAWGAPPKDFVQDAIAAPKTMDFEDAVLNAWFQLEDDDGLDVTNTTVTAVTIGGEPGVLGTHFKHDAAAGLVQVIEIPEDAIVVAGKFEVSVTFTAAAVAAGSGRQIAETFTENVLRGKLVVRQNNRRGRPRKFVFAKISVGGDGEVAVIGDSNEPVSVTVTGKIERDENMPAGRERGWIIDL